MYFLLLCLLLIIAAGAFLGATISLTLMILSSCYYVKNDYFLRSSCQPFLAAMIYLLFIYS